MALLGTRELAAGNLGFLSSNVAGYALIVGLVSALDTLANQASRFYRLRRTFGDDIPWIGRQIRLAKAYLSVCDEGLPSVPHGASFHLPVHVERPAYLPSHSTAKRSGS